MNIHWIFNGTLQAHHLVAVYLTVWIIQGGYAAWITWQWVQSRRAEKGSAVVARQRR